MAEPVDPATENPKFLGKRFVFTGELPNLSRERAGALVKEWGGEVVVSVSKNTDFLVAGKNPGSKYRKAVNLGINILDPQRFQEMIYE